MIVTDTFRMQKSNNTQRSKRKAKGNKEKPKVIAKTGRKKDIILETLKYHFKKNLKKGTREEKKNGKKPDEQKAQEMFD
jgi:hypothetical protein